MTLQEAKRFDGIDKSWKKIMQDTAKNPNVLEACSVDGRLDNLRMLSEQLETCQKSLSEYLDTKRCAFPRSVNFQHILCNQDHVVWKTKSPHSCAAYKP